MANQDSTENNMADELQSTDNETQQSDNIFVVYQEGGGFDVYEDGDRYGYKMEISFEGDVILYERIYRKVDGDRSMDEVEINKGKVDESQLDSLSSTIEKSGFFEYPNRLPDVSPLEVEIRTPAEQISISIRKSPDEEIKKVRANLGADHKHYPEGFFELRREFRQLMNQFRN